MKRIGACLFFILIFTNSFLSAQETNVIPGDLLVMLGSDKDILQLTSDLNNINGLTTGLKLVRVVSNTMHIYLFRFDASTVDQRMILNAVKVHHLVKLAQFNHTFEMRNTPNDPDFSQQWNMHNTGQNNGTIGADIDALNAWNITTGGLTSTGDTIVVAVVDGGFDLTQPDLNFWINHHEIPNNHIDDDKNGYVDDYEGWNSVAKNDSLGVAFHGTYVCGIVGARGNNCLGVTGVNWNVKIMAVSTEGSDAESDVVSAYTYVLDLRREYTTSNGAKGAFVVATNSSFGVNLGQPSAYPLWCAMYDSLGSAGILSAGATTNSNIDVDTQGDIPTACPSNWLITVTNTTNTDAKAAAGYGDTTIDLGAPGTNIISTFPSDTNETLSGTSVSSPHVAGAVALMYSVACPRLMADYKSNPAAVALMIKDSLLKAVDTIPSLKGKTVTGGRLNLFKSVRAIQNHYSIDSCPNMAVVPKNCMPYNEQPGNPFEIKNVYPNPANNILNVVYTSNENAEITMVNLLGQEVLSVKVNNTAQGTQQSIMDVSSLAQGIYFLNLISGNKKSNAIKVIVY